MTQEISSLMDGELAARDAERALRSCGASEEHKATWYLYHCIGDAMRGQAPRSFDRPLALLTALHGEPTVLAPRRPLESPYTRIALAAAASVATIGVVGWLGIQGIQGGQGASAPVVAKASSGIQPVSNKTTLSARDAIQPLEVQAYLTAHRQIPPPELYRPVNNREPAPAR
jgi:sigma-E factor negative regulatory protein RseA